jgi:hypothetical protein
MKPTQLAYFAGLLDGEGCIRVKRQRKYWGPKQALEGWQYSVAVYIANSCRAPLDEARATFGGHIGTCAGTNKPTEAFGTGLSDHARQRLLCSLRGLSV